MANLDSLPNLSILSELSPLTVIFGGGALNVDLIVLAANTCTKRRFANEDSCHDSPACGFRR
jgi:hypothetical protein